MVTTSLRQRRLLRVTMAIVIMGCVVAIGVLNRRVESTTLNQVANSDSPEGCIARMQAAQERGDVPAYLGCFVSAERESIEQQWQGISQSQNAADLRNRSIGVMGRATTDIKLIDTDHAQLVVETIRQDSVDRQSVTLYREGGSWKIAGISTADRTTPKIPYGTPVDAQQ